MHWETYEVTVIMAKQCFHTTIIPRSDQTDTTRDLGDSSSEKSDSS